MEGEEQLSLARLAGIFARVGSLSFGGGGSTLAMMHAELCVRRRVLPPEEFQLLFGLSRVVPGMNLLSLTVLIGHRARGVPGALVALAALTVPSFLVILLACRLLAGEAPGPHLAGAVRALGPAAAALLAHTGWQLCRATLRKERPPARAAWLGVAAAAALLALQAPLHPAWLILGGGLGGALLAPRLRGPEAGEAGDADPPGEPPR